MNKIALAVTAALLASCGPNTEPPEAIVNYCDEQVPGYTGTVRGDGIYVDGAGWDDPTFEQNIAQESAACTLAVAEAPDETWRVMLDASSTGSGNGTEQWGGYEAVWSYTPDGGLIVLLKPR